MNIKINAVCKTAKKARFREYPFPLSLLRMSKILHCNVCLKSFKRQFLGRGSTIYVSEFTGIKTNENDK
jgi:hypothetical protein